jgi:uncharacterized membrane protein
MESLLKVVGLSGRMVYEEKEVSSLIYNDNIDFKEIENHIKKARVTSMNFFNKALL